MMGKIPDALIAKYIQNECSEEENALIENWLTNNEKNKDEVKMAQKIFEKENRNDMNPDTDKALKSVLDRLPEQKKPKSIQNWNWLQIAAILLLVVGATYLAIRFTGTTDVELITYKQDKFDKAQFQLPDGSTIWIREGGKVAYPSKFEGRERKIQFSGEGYFKITSDARHPFIIEGGGTVTRVTGTKFTLNTASIDSIVYLVLEEGKVEFAPAGFKKKDFMKVEPGQKLSFDKSNNNIEIKKNNDLNYLSWKTKSYKYLDKPIKDIVTDIEFFYNVRFEEMHASFSNELFSFEFDSLSALDEVLENLEILTESKIEKIGDNYYIKPNS